MGVPRERQLRAVGRRIGYDAVPAAVRDHVRDRFGAHKVLREHVGGVSPGCATSLATADGGRVFVKAVGQELHERTTEIFRREAELLRRLPDVGYRPRLLDRFEDGGWVALCLQHIDGENPDLTDDRDFDAVADTIRRQTGEMTPPPADVVAESLAETALRWASQWKGITRDPGAYLPVWAAHDAPALTARVLRLPAALQPESLCHFDVRDDNLLLTGAGNPVVLDWGNPRLGPAWTDLVFLAAQRRDAEAAVAWLDTELPDAVRDTVRRSCSRSEHRRHGTPGTDMTPTSLPCEPIAARTPRGFSRSRGCFWIDRSRSVREASPPAERSRRAVMTRHRPDIAHFCVEARCDECAEA